MQQQVNMAQAQAGAPGMYAPPGTIPQYSHHPGMVNPYQPGMPGMPGAPATVTMLPSSTPQPAATSQSFTMPSGKCYSLGQRLNVHFVALRCACIRCDFQY